MSFWLWRVLLMLVWLLGSAHAAVASAPQGDSPADAIGLTPPRVSYIDGAVSFWRPGAKDWAPAAINTPLAPGDELYTGHPGNLELQIGGRAFVRAWGDSQLGLANLEPDFVQLKVTSGRVSVDLRSVDPGRTVEIDTPHAAFTIEHPGYYRIDVTPERTSFITRRAGRATVTSADGQTVGIAPGEQVVLEGAPTPIAQRLAAPELDVWDRWNYARTDSVLNAVSARYVPSDVYGVADLDRHGTWRVEPSYGAVWVPSTVAAGWVPYSTGRWILDPFYGWTWIDTAPWGWAPFHHGRWVHLHHRWAWVPGPIVARPVYAPALVAFFGGPRAGVAFGTPFVSWVALGWGEPVVPWWGRHHFVGRPWWGGWGGPRVVNNVIVHERTVIKVEHLTVYRNVTVRDAVVGVRHDHFGRRAVNEARTAVDPRRLEPVRGAPAVTPDAASFVPSTGRATRPPDSTIARHIVATRPPAPRRADPPDGGARRDGAVVSVPAPRLVNPPRPASPAGASPRPPVGAAEVERPRPPRPSRPDATAAPVRNAAPPAPRVEPRPGSGTATLGAGPGPGGPTSPARVEPPASRAPSRPPGLGGGVSNPPAAVPRIESPGRAGEPERPGGDTRGSRDVPRAEPVMSRGSVPRVQAPAPPDETRRPPARPLPGEPVNRRYPGVNEQGQQGVGFPDGSPMGPGRLHERGGR